MAQRGLGALPDGLSHGGFDLRLPRCMLMLRGGLHGGGGGGAFL